MNKKMIEKIYKLSPLQQGMLYTYMRDSENKNYRIQFEIVVKGEFDEKIAKKCFELLVAKHEIFRTLIPLNSFQKPIQIVLKSIEVPYQSWDLTGFSEEQQEERKDELIKKDLERGFDLEKNFCERFAIYKLSEKKFVMLWSFHHIILDGWSLGLLMKDFQYFYNELETGTSYEHLLQQVKSESTGVSYQQYIRWLENQDKNKCYKYWEKTLLGYDDEARIIPEYNISSGNDSKLVKIQFNTEQTKQIEKIANYYSVTLSTMVEAAVGLVLQHYCNCKDVVIGKVISGRDISLNQAENIVGLFINTIPSRITSNFNMNIGEFLQQLQKQGIESQNYGILSLAEIKSAIGNRKLEYVLYAFENYAFDHQLLKSNGKRVYEVGQYREQTNYDLTVRANSINNLCIELLYNSEVYSERFCSHILNNIKKILMFFSSDKDLGLNDIHYLDEEETNIITKFNHHDAETYMDVVTQFEKSVEENKKRLAIGSKDRKFTYEELNKYINRIANRLIEMGVNHGDTIAISGERTVFMPMGMIAILKVGACYVPIDKKHPITRQEFILEETKAKFLLVGQKEDSLQLSDVKEIIIEEVVDEGENDIDPKRAHSNQDLAYIIYTSGTSGKPKGVLIEHRSITRLVYKSNFLDFNKEQRYLATGSSAFDASTLEIFGSLMNGGYLYICTEEQLSDVNEIERIIRNEKINIMWLTTALFNQLVNLRPQIFSRLNDLFIGGERASEYHVREFQRINPQVQLHNAYGPTENTTFTSVYTVPNNFKNLPIGKPIKGTQCYIMRQNLECGIGIPGELCVTGDGVARGYLNRPELTKTKFERNPFGKGFMYHTGDLVRWLPDGNLDFLGRIDEQVKIRGFRVELGDIETQLRKASEVKDAVVVYRDGQLNAYIVAKADQKLDFKKIKFDLSKKLPEYMIPRGFMQIDKIPTTKNGKVNKGALPKVEVSIETEYLAPRNDTEKALCMIMSDVLEVDKVGIRDNFFELGGHSLHAMRLLNLIDKKLGKTLSLKQIFAYPTVEGISENLQNTAVNEWTEIETVEEGPYNMSSMQKRLYVVSKLDKTGISYNIPVALVYEGKVEKSQVEKVMQQLIRRHEILRTRFVFNGEEAYQEIIDEVPFVLEYEQDAQAELNQLIDEFVRPFDLENAPLLRVRQISTGDKSGYLLFDIHHIIADGTSMNILVSEFCALYDGIELEPLRVQYKDYVAWLNKQDQSNAREYWLKQYEEEPLVLDLPLDNQRSVMQDFSGAQITAMMNQESSCKIDEFCHKEGITPFMMLIGSLMVLLGKYSRQEDIVVGTPISGRTHSDTENMVGLFVNTLAMRGRPERKKKVREFFGEIKQHCLEAFKYQSYPFEELVEEVVKERDFGRNPLFDVMLTLQNQGSKELKCKEWSAGRIIGKPVAKFDLDFNVENIKGQYYIGLTYATSILKESSAEEILNQYMYLIEDICENPDKCIRELELCSQEKILREIEPNQGEKKTIERGKTVKEVFEEISIRYKKEIALRQGAKELTYEEVNERANAIAYKLKEKEIGAKDQVIILADRSVEMVIGMLGVIKSGAAYVPLDPMHPEHRLKTIAEEVGAKGILYKLYGKLAEKLAGDECSILNLEIYQEREKKNLETINDSNDIAYILYTSGTTGKPKGVMVDHGNLMNYLYYAEKNYGMNRITAPLFTSISFDLTVTSIYLPLITGGSLDVLTGDIQENIRTIAQSNKYSFMKMTPSHLNLALMESAKPLSNLNHLVVGGEELEETLAKQVQKNWGEWISIHNEYGPTETTVGCCDEVYEERKEDKNYKHGVSIGCPQWNTDIYIMQEDQLCPVNVPGELCISGAGVTQGYYRNEEKTRKVFVNNPFGIGKLYRTGDLARWTKEGKLEYMGRIDQQVKIHGFRVELGEIQAILVQVPEVTEAVVICIEEMLLAYVVGKKEVKLDLDVIKKYMYQRLPEYMVPQGIIQIDSIPLTVNGKVDVRKLPEINMESKAEYVAPRNDKEKALCKILSDVLGIEKIGINDNFFELGGDSIKAIRVIMQVRNLGYELSIKDVLSGGQISSIVDYLVPIHKEYEQDEVNGSVIMAAIQEQFIEWNLKKPDQYCQSVAIHCDDMFNVEMLEKILEALVTTHDCLRMVYHHENAEILCKDECLAPTVVYSNMKGIDDSIVQMGTIINELQDTISLEKGPLVAASLFDTREGKILVLIIHHFVVDFVSWRILEMDFNIAYEQLKQNQEIHLPLKTASYQEWTRSLQEYSMSHEFDSEYEYWKEVDQNLEKIFEGKSIEIGSERGVINFLVDPTLTQDLIYKSSQAYNTRPDEILITVLAESLAEISKDNQVAIDLESHGRSEAWTDIKVNHTVGWFTAIYPVCIEIKDYIEETLIECKEKMRKVPNLGIGYGLYRKKVGKKQKSSSVVQFNYFGDSSANNMDTSTRDILRSSNDKVLENKLPYKMICNFEILDSGLSGQIVYDNSEYRQFEMEKFVTNFKDKLEGLIQTCIQKEKVEYTPTDFNDDLEFEELNDIMNIFE